MLKKRILVFTIFLSLLIGLSSCSASLSNSDDDLTDDDLTDDDGTVEGFLVDFVLDEHTTVTVYDTQDYANGVVATSAYAKDSDTGEILTDGEGQVNFVVSVDDGYEIDTIIATPSDNYNNLKDPVELELASTYRLTKIEGDVTVTITTKEEGSESVITEFVGTFILDEHVTVTVYATQDYTNGEVTTTASAKDSDTGELLVDGDGQINFVVTVDEGYEIDTIVVAPEDFYKNLKDPVELELANAYRITKVAGDLTITITTKEAN
ncbi:MAG: hypothetical protein WCR19_02945 [Acholeplasmataceae bacterium]